MNDQDFSKARAEITNLQGSIGGVTAHNESSSRPQREPAKFRMRRIIDRLQREAKEADCEAMQLNALFNALPETLSPDADEALDYLLNCQLKRE